ncbi:MAG: hypothetical protein OEY29_04915 [Gammaproteobacteria bacterium]|nr:hypothetical protein [Gammaproteobacteria bacterium]
MKDAEKIEDTAEFNAELMKIVNRERKKEIKRIFKKYRCPEHRQYAKLISIERADGAFDINFSSCCEQHRQLIEAKVSEGA